MSTASSVRMAGMGSRGGARGLVMLGLGLALSAACGSAFHGAPSGGAGAGGSAASPHAGNPNAAGTSGRSAAGSASDGGSSGSNQGGAPSPAGGALSGGAGSALSGGAGSAPSGGDEPGGAASAGAGGAAGGAGPDVTPSECDTDQDCQIVNDCCTCAALPKSDAKPSCSAVCVQSACQARGLAAANAQCVANRCVFDVSCDGAGVTCEAPTPSCPSGQVPSVSGSCWGPCIAAHDCRAVSNCDDCSASQICVNNELRIRSTHCVEAAGSCARHPTCDCANACDFQCSDEDGISCFCITC